MIDQIAAALGRRSAAGMSTSRITLKRGPHEEKLDIKRVKRHLGDSSSSARPEIIQSGWYVFCYFPWSTLVTHSAQAIILASSIRCVCVGITEDPRRRFSIRDTGSNARLLDDQRL